MSVFIHKILISVLVILSGLFIFSASLGSGSRDGNSKPDTIVKMHGYVYDTFGVGATKVPVKAKLIFESIPYGSEIGIITSNDTSGYYEFYVNTSKQYNVNVNSGSHYKFSEKLETHSMVSNGEIKKDFYLQLEIKENQVFTLKNLIFEQGQASITPDSYRELNRLADLMAENEKMVIQLEGHTDFRGGKKLNFELSEDRVEAVKSYLVNQGIQSKRVQTKAYGGSRPLTKEGSIEAASINRRVEVRILKLN
jgi:outer membrane protein OmpA-like peptidoglycan-associated protein